MAMASRFIGPRLSRVNLWVEHAADHVQIEAAVHQKAGLTRPVDSIGRRRGELPYPDRPGVGKIVGATILYRLGHQIVGDAALPQFRPDAPAAVAAGALAHPAFDEARVR